MMVIYKCVLCGNSIRKLVQSKPAPYLNCQCGGILEKQVPNISATSYEVIDDGNSMKKAVRREGGMDKLAERGNNYVKEMNDRENLLGKDIKDDYED